ncbi:MAG: C40 family peptidase [Mogibacterium sp.]|nr:C40 family peptidase [Mogibacterium sp.]
MNENKEKNYTIEQNKQVMTEHHDNDGFGEDLGRSYTRVSDNLRRNRRKYAIISVAAAVLIAIGGVSAAAVANVAPYAISINGKQVCTVSGKNEAEVVVKGLVADYVPEGSVVKAISTDDMIKVEPAESASEARDNAVGVDEAIENLKDAISESKDDAKAEITVVSTGMEVEKFTPKTKYIKDDTMLAGEAVVEVEAKKGSKEVTKRYTTVNGEVTGEEVLKETVIKKGKAAKIRKGTLGLPEGEDWKTYEGDPIYQNGEELTQTALNYLGAPYKYGGHSLVNGIDCVQFIRQMYAKYGISLPNGKNALKHVGFAVNYKDMRPGDIICYSNHYALYIGNGKIVHAIRKGVSVGNNPKYRGIVTIRRVVG